MKFSLFNEIFANIKKIQQNNLSSFGLRSRFKVSFLAANRCRTSFWLKETILCYYKITNDYDQTGSENKRNILKDASCCFCVSFLSISF